MTFSALRRSLLGLCLSLLGSAILLPATAAADGYQVQSVRSWMQNAVPMGWSASLNRVIYNSRGPDGMFDAYSANPDGRDPRCLTCTIPSFPGVGANTNRGAEDVSPDGRYMLVSVENPDGSQTGAAYTQPGKGGDNDVWLATTDGTKSWPLTHVSAPGQFAFGTMWARFDRTGKEIVWASMYAPAAMNLGYWQLKVANIVWKHGVPSLADVRTIEPQAGHFYEPYGFTPDDSHILFASDANMPTWMDSQIDTISIDGKRWKRLSPDDSSPGIFSNYNEFAFYTPDDNWIIYGRTHDAISGGLDYWIMRPDGSDSQPLTFLNSPWSTESRGYSVVGGLTFDPHNPNRFLADVATDISAQHINAVMVTLAPDTPSSGLSEQFSAGQSFGRPISTTTGNPSSGFEANAAPAARVPSTNYSIRWSGTLTPPVSGTYTFCTVAEYSDQLRLGRRLLVDGSDSFGQRRCATATETAGVPTPIEFDYEHAGGMGFAQISWIPPGATTATIIPSPDLRPSRSSATPATPAARRRVHRPAARGSRRAKRRRSRRHGHKRSGTKRRTARRGNPHKRRVSPPGHARRSRTSTRRASRRRHGRSTSHRGRAPHSRVVAHRRRI